MSMGPNSFRLPKFNLGVNLPAPSPQLQNALSRVPAVDPRMAFGGTAGRGIPASAIPAAALGALSFGSTVPRAAPAMPQVPAAIQAPQLQPQPQPDFGVFKPATAPAIPMPTMRPAAPVQPSSLFDSGAGFTTFNLSDGTTERPATVGDAFAAIWIGDLNYRLNLPDDVVRSAVAAHELIEVVRSDKNLVLPPAQAVEGTSLSTLQTAQRGRLELEKDILAAAQPKLTELGIELLDVRIKRVNYRQDVVESIYRRMISERQQIAQRFRSEGEGEAARINGRRERELNRIESEAYKRVQELRGEADAEATRVYADAYDKTPEAREFYGFLKTLDTYRKILGDKTNVILSTDSELFRLLDKTN